MGHGLSQIGAIRRGPIRDTSLQARSLAGVSLRRQDECRGWREDLGEWGERLVYPHTRRSMTRKSRRQTQRLGSGGRFFFFLHLRRFNDPFDVQQANRRRPPCAEIGQFGILGLQHKPIAKIDAIIGPDEPRLLFNHVQHTQPHSTPERLTDREPLRAPALVAIALVMRRQRLIMFYLTRLPV